MKTKLVLGVFVALLVALLAGWLWGASGKWDLDRALQVSELRTDLLQARSSVLVARLDVYSVNFGDASRHLEDARGLLRRAGERLKSLGRPDDVKRLDLALVRIDEAQRLAGQLDQEANSRAAEAAQTIDAVLGTGAKR
jgi:hypothetical protein